MKINVVKHPSGTVRIIETDDGQKIVQRAEWICNRCKTDAYVPHYNCIYRGMSMGHSESHCTADACY